MLLLIAILLALILWVLIDKNSAKLAFAYSAGCAMFLLYLGGSAGICAVIGYGVFQVVGIDPYIGAWIGAALGGGSFLIWLGDQARSR